MPPGLAWSELGQEGPPLKQHQGLRGLRGQTPPPPLPAVTWARCSPCCATSPGAAGGADPFPTVYSWESRAWTEAVRGPGSGGAQPCPWGHHDRGLGWEVLAWGIMIRGPRRSEVRKDPGCQPREGSPVPRHRPLGAPGTQPLGRVQTGTGRGWGADPGAPCPPTGGPCSCSPWPLAQGFAVGSPPPPTPDIRGPLLYFNACFYGNIYGTHVARKTPL